MQEIYLDNAATTPVCPAVAEVMNQALRQDYGNPSSLHAKGLEAERLVQSARETVARALGVSTAEVVFTSGGTEANNLALLGTATAAPSGRRHLVTTAVEHASVLEPAAMLEQSGWTVTRLGVTGQGVLDAKELETALRPETFLVSTMHVNNEVGSVQPLEEIAAVLNAVSPRPFWHVDAVQSLGKVPLSLRRLPVDLLAVSAHKLHGPKGCGALMMRKGVSLQPRSYGGGQEHSLRPGTENVPGIAGFSRALSLALEDEDSPRRMARLRRILWVLLTQEVPDVEYNGSGEAAPHILNLSVPGLQAEILVNALAQRGIYVSSGSACASRDRQPSHVLRAMGVSGERLDGALRISLSRLTTEEELRQAARALGQVVRELAPFHRR